MKTLTLLTAAICCTLFVNGQPAGSTIMLNNVMEIDETRYEGIDKSPYLFKEFVAAKVYDKKAEKTEEYLMNFNGHTQDFEFKYKGATIALNDAYYDLIEMADGVPNENYAPKFASESVTFTKGLNPEAPKKFQILIYADSKVSIYKDFKMRVQTSESTNSGQGIISKTFFTPVIGYYIVENGVSTRLRMNKKSVIESLGNAEVASYIKKNKLKVNSEEGLKAVMAYYNGVTKSDVVAVNN